MFILYLHTDTGSKINKVKKEIMAESAKLRMSVAGLLQHISCVYHSRIHGAGPVFRK